LIITVLSHAEDNIKSNANSTPYYYISANVLQGITVVVGDEKPLPTTPSLLWQMQVETTAKLTCTIHDLG